jgi:hypothetical protein
MSGGGKLFRLICKSYDRILQAILSFIYLQFCTDQISLNCIGAQKVE